MKKSTIIASALALAIAGVASAGKPVMKATGGGTVEWPNGLVTYGFNAQADADGIAKGQFQIHHRDVGDGFSTHGYVNCLNVIGNVAWIGGIVTKSDYELIAPVDGTMLIMVVDNGEGFADPPDEISSASYDIFEADACLRQPAGIGLEFTNGNIQVKGELLE